MKTKEEIQEMLDYVISKQDKWLQTSMTKESAINLKSDIEFFLKSNREKFESYYTFSIYSQSAITDLEEAVKNLDSYTTSKLERKHNLYFQDAYNQIKSACDDIIRLCKSLLKDNSIV